MNSDDTQEETKPALYDADAKQKITFNELSEEGEVVCHYESVSDERYAEFTREAKTRIVDDGENIEIDNAEGLIKLWNETVFDIDGIEGEKPVNWKDEIDDYKHKIPSISAYLAVAAYSGKKVWGQTDETIFTEAFFNGELAIQKHFLRKKTVEDIKAHRQFQRIPLNSKSKGLQSKGITLSSYAVKKGELYDQMRINDAEGYAKRVPLWHKVAVIDFIFAAGLSQKK